MECLHPKYLPSREMYVPCGACAFCGATRRSDWATRLHYERKLHTSGSFVTLTYSDNNLTYVKGVSTLVKDDLQRFFKRLRKGGAFFRYYAVGEYGSQTARPHYHVLFFGDVDEVAIRKAWSKWNRKTDKYYALGQVHIGKVTAQSVMYCLGYLVNGKKGPSGKRGVARQFALMSRGDRKPGSKFRYGLGHNYLSKAMIEWHRSGRKNYVVLDGAKKHLPRYYKDRIFSAIDKVRIAVATEKETFKRLLRFIRHPLRMRMRDPLAYYEAMLRQQAGLINKKSKLNLSI